MYCFVESGRTYVKQVLQKIHKYVSLVIRKAHASKKEIHKALFFRRYVSMLEFGHTRIMCFEKEVRKARTLVLCPFQECFCGTGNLGFD